MKYIVLALLTLSVACNTSAPQAPSAPPNPTVEGPSTAVSTTAETVQACGSCDDCAACAKTNPSYFYSPFVVSLAGNSPFKKVSFKDVGLKRDAPKPTDPILEVIAESLAHKLSQSELKLEAQVSYDESILDPNNHVACGSDHLYVDVWRRGDDTIGYSLWSGCGEDDNFAWKEVTASFAPGDEASASEPLAEAITQSLWQATQKSCFQKSC